MCAADWHGADALSLSGAVVADAAVDADRSGVQRLAKGAVRVQLHPDGLGAAGVSVRAGVSRRLRAQGDNDDDAGAGGTDHHAGAAATDRHH